MKTSNTQGRILANSTYLDNKDFVTIDANGFLARTAAAEKITGIYIGTSVTATIDNQTVAKVVGYYEPIQEDMEFELTSDQACTDTDVGAYADIKLSTNAFQLDLAAGASGQMYVIDYDVNATTTVRCKVAEPAGLAFALA
jgi:hypothetical protein